MATPIPFRWIKGLPPEAQKELERNFLHLQGQITGGVSLFDAIIDGALTSSDSGNHRYKNLTDLVAGESGWTATKLMVVGVIGRPGTPSVDTAAIVLPGPLTLMGGGIQSRYFDAPPAIEQSRPLLDIRGQISFASPSTSVNLIGVEIANLGGGTIGALFNANISLFMHNAQITGINAAGTQAYTTLGCGTLFAVGATFYSVFPTGTLDGNWVLDSGVVWGALGNLVLTKTLYWSGVAFFNATGTPTLTLGGAATYYLDLQGVVSNAWSASSGGSLDLTISSTGSIDVHSTTQVFRNLNIAAGAGSTVVDGSFANVVVAGNNGGSFGLPLARRINVVIFGGTAPTLDFTGPGTVTADFVQGIGLHQRATLRGANVHATLRMPESADPALSLVACTDSYVTANLAASGAGAQAYAIDSASARCVLVLTGTHQANFTIASTNLGTSCLVIDEQGATDPVRKDLLPADLIAPTSGVIVIPAPAPGSAPTGAAAGSLAGTYPNPIFRGRDSSVDEINKDLLPTALLSADAGVQTIPSAASGSGGSSNLDGGVPSSVYGGTVAIDGGTP